MKDKELREYLGVVEILNKRTARESGGQLYYIRNRITKLEKELTVLRTNFNSLIQKKKTRR